MVLVSTKENRKSVRTIQKPKVFNFGQIKHTYTFTKEKRNNKMNNILLEESNIYFKRMCFKNQAPLPTGLISQPLVKFSMWLTSTLKKSDFMWMILISHSKCNFSFSAQRCWRCKKVGHLKKDCWRGRKRQNKKDNRKCSSM